MRSDILHWFEQNIKRWVKPARLVLISGLLSDITLSRGELIAENAFLRQQIMVLDRQIKRPRLTNQDRLLFVLLARFTNSGSNPFLSFNRKHFSAGVGGGSLKVSQRSR